MSKHSNATTIGSSGLDVSALAANIVLLVKQCTHTNDDLGSSGSVHFLHKALRAFAKDLKQQGVSLKEMKGLFERARTELDAEAQQSGGGNRRNDDQQKQNIEVDVANVFVGYDTLLDTMDWVYGWGSKSLFDMTKTDDDDA